MFYYRFDVAYLGLDYQGFQSQAHGCTIQDHLQQAAAVLLRAPSALVAASRTDSGVSARQQVGRISSERSLNTRDFLHRWNALLPSTIRVYGLREVAQDFHPIASSMGKIYRYRLWLGSCRDPFLYPYVWQVPEGLLLQRFKEQLAAVRGRHNFKAFTKKGSAAKSYERTVVEVQVAAVGGCLSAGKEKGEERREERCIEVWIHGDGFLRHMIRTLVGTAVDLSLPRPPLRLTSLQAILATENRSEAYRTAPGAPLCLMRCLYPGEMSSIDEERAVSKQQGMLCM